MRGFEFISRQFHQLLLKPNCEQLGFFIACCCGSCGLRRALFRQCFGLISPSTAYFLSDSGPSKKSNSAKAENSGFKFQSVTHGRFNWFYFGIGRQLVHLYYICVKVPLNLVKNSSSIHPKSLVHHDARSPWPFLAANTKI